MSKTRISTKDLFRDLEHDPEYLAEYAIVEFTEDMAKRMEDLGITRSELARRLDTSPAYITKILQGNANFTLKSMVRIAQALEADLKTHLQPEGVQSQWFDLFQSDAQVGQRKNPPVNVQATLASYRPVHLPANREDVSDDPIAPAA